MKRQWIMKHEEDTKSFGQHLANNLKPGDVVALIGDLGTGKTALTKAVATGLGVTEMITSPTFTIVCEYHEGRMPLYHFDVYRVYDPDELFEIGLRIPLRAGCMSDRMGRSGRGHFTAVCHSCGNHLWRRSHRTHL